MRPAVVVAALVLLASVPLATGAQRPNQVQAQTRDQAGMQLLLSRSRVDPGPGKVEFYNGGEDAHDLVMRREGGAKEIQFPELEHGEDEVIDVRFKRSARYALWCSLKTHRLQGMEATLKVRRR